MARPAPEGSALVAVDLVTGVLRSARLRPSVVSALGGLALVVVPLVLGWRVAYLDATTLLHVSLAVTVCGAAFALDDATHEMADALPVSPARVALMRMGASFTLVVASWAAQLALAPHVIEATGVPYAGWRLFIEAPTVVVWVWVAAWFARRRRAGGNGSALAAPVMLLALLLVGFLPDGVALYLAPADAGFAASRLRWLAVLGVGAAVLAVALRRRR